MARKYKTGDIVQLKSGGPKMTVKQYAREFTEDVHNTGLVETVVCQWFAGSKNQQAGFPENSLEQARPDGKG